MTTAVENHRQTRRSHRYPGIVNYSYGLSAPRLGYREYLRFTPRSGVRYMRKRGLSDSLSDLAGTL